MQPPYSTDWTRIVLQKLLKKWPWAHVTCSYWCGLGCPVSSPASRDFWACVQPLHCSAGLEHPEAERARSEAYEFIEGSWTCLLSGQCCHPHTQGPMWLIPASLSFHRAFHTCLPATAISITLCSLQPCTHTAPCSKSSSHCSSIALFHDHP